MRLSNKIFKQNISKYSYCTTANEIPNPIIESSASKPIRNKEPKKLKEIKQDTKTFKLFDLIKKYGPISRPKLYRLIRDQDPESEEFYSKRHFGKIINSLIRWEMVGVKNNKECVPPKEGNIPQKAYFLYFSRDHPIGGLPNQEVPSHLVEGLKDYYKVKRNQQPVDQSQEVIQI
eukprot:TRINITY_DN3322_c0_g3_i1.p1 TRINITY_DN3322_c0_g3~~TRINITY_DN3322_c0_g3_i1.p1  ORF type:complete len:175 (-),score=41.44 TRINITY_DN3322_c0_g3_i1:68-592(-)